MNDFSLPTNIKQIGSIGDGMRIYMEDYVCTYLSQYAEAGGYDERIAMLVGRYLLIDGQPVLFISGAIQGKYTAEKDGLLYFTDKSIAYVNSMIAEFFEGMEVIGWMQTQPGYGVFLNQQYASYHFREFPKINQVMFVMDPLEHINAFYTYNDDRTGLTEARGYFIYYDKNTNMHEYMLSNKATEPEYEPKPAAYIDLPKIERAADDDFYADATRPEEMIRKRQEERKSRKSVKEHKRTLNLLVSLSAVLFVVCFVMGAGLIQNQNRIDLMEGQIIQLNTAYRNLHAEIGRAAGLAAVFAPIEDASTAPPPPVLPTVPGEPVTPTVPAVPETPAAPSVPTTTGGLEISGIPVHPPVTATPPPPSPQATRSIPETYTIQPGDSLSAISLYFYGMDRVSDILELNNMTDPNMIIAGRTILLP